MESDASVSVNSSLTTLCRLKKNTYHLIYNMHVEADINLTQ